MSSIDLAGAHVFVAGVGSGIGSACVRVLAGGGARVSCFDIDRTAAEAAAELAGGIEHTFVGDARNYDAVAAAVTDAETRHGPLTAAVDVIGEARWGRTIDLDDAAWDESFDMVLRHFFNLARAAGPRLAHAGGGAMVAIASVSGLRSAPLHGPYGAAKAGLMSLVRTLAVELARDGVRVDAVAPGRGDDSTGGSDHERGAAGGSAAQIPLGRYASPTDIANAVAFLVSDLASYITGQTLAVDGGATAQFPLSLRA